MPRTSANGVGARVKARRLELGLSQRDLSEPGVSYAYISRIESGARRPSVRALRRLADRLGVSAYWLETGERDAAEALAQLVLESGGQPSPRKAVRLARAALSQRAAELDGR